MISLLDVNVLFALAWPRHVHHDPALEWFEEARHDGWATCAITESGFVRISCNPVIVGHEVTPNEAIQILERLMAVPMVLAAQPLSHATAIGDPKAPYRPQANY